MSLCNLLKYTKRELFWWKLSVLSVDVGTVLKLLHLCPGMSDLCHAGGTWGIYFANVWLVHVCRCDFFILFSTFSMLWRIFCKNWATLRNLTSKCVLESLCNYHLIFFSIIVHKLPSILMLFCTLKFLVQLCVICTSPFFSRLPFWPPWLCWQFWSLLFVL